MKITKSKLKQLIKEEIEAVREALFDGEFDDDNENLFGGEYDDENVDIFEPSTYEGMFDSEVLDSFEESLREFISAYLDDEDLNMLEDDEMEDLKAAVMTALEGADIAEDEEEETRMIVKTALEDVEAANGTGDLKLGI
jgi:hypothetical protein